MVGVEGAQERRRGREGVVYLDIAIAAVISALSFEVGG